jgi:ATP phosphoribosyltransferase regulatory subunit
MSSAWLLPEHIADVLPSQARRVEELRRVWLDAARGYGYELVMPPLLEHIESLLSGTGHALDLKTFKLVDQLSGRTLGLRADATPQVARIDAHLLNRDSVTRLAYCGPVLHTRPTSPHATREPLQLGAEIYGHSGLEAELESTELALGGLQASGLSGLVIDVADVRLVRGVLAAYGLDRLSAAAQEAVIAALNVKDVGGLRELHASGALGDHPGALEALVGLTGLFGGLEVLDRARAQLPSNPLIDAALRDLRWLAEHLQTAQPDVTIGFDLSDLSGYAYYSGIRFAIFAQGHADALVRGGRCGLRSPPPRRRFQSGFEDLGGGIGWTRGREPSACHSRTLGPRARAASGGADTQRAGAHGGVRAART